VSRNSIASLTMIPREWLRMPFCDRRKILERQDGVAMAARADNIDFLSSLAKYLRKIHDLPKLVLRIKKVSQLQQ
jgi:DNA mismatch repair ATPase MutS